MSRPIGNDPTGTYQGWCQNPKRRNRGRWHKKKRRGAKRKVMSSKAFSTESAYHGGEKPVAIRPVRVSQVAKKPDYEAWKVAQVSNDFWSRIRPKAAASCSLPG